MFGKMRMTLCLLLSIAVWFMSTPIVVNAEDVGSKILDISEDQGTVRNELEMFEHYDALSLAKRIQISTAYFSEQIERYAIMEDSLVGLINIGMLKNIQHSITLDGELSVQVYEKMNQTIIHIRGLNNYGQEPYKKTVNEMLREMKEARLRADALISKVDTQLNRLQVRQKVTLLNAAHLAEKLKDTDKALEAYSKISIMNGGDMEALTSIQDLISEDKDYYVYFNHGLISLKSKIVNRNGKTYLPVEALSHLKGFEYTDNLNTKSQLISFGNDVLVITEQAATINGSYIGSPFLIINTEQGSYIDMKIVFEMFGFEITALDAFDMLYIVKPHLSNGELDRLSVEAMMGAIFN